MPQQSAGPLAETPAPSSAPASYIRELCPDVAQQRKRSETAAEQIIQALVEAGVRVFFGIPGGPVSPLFDAILGNTTARLVESRHESAAAFAAADYYRASGRIAAVVVTAGPGATNAITGVASASAERIPMLVLCGDVAWASGGGRLLQDSGPEGVDVERILAPSTRIQLRVRHANNAVPKVLHALRCATTRQKPGPSLVVLPIHLGGARDQATAVESDQAETPAVLPTAQSLLRSHELLRDAEQPLVILGTGCRGHEQALTALIEEAQIPFVTTPQAKGLLSEDHPLSLRNAGLAASRWARAYIKDGVDTALALGTDLDDCSIGPTRYVNSQGKLIHVDLDATVFGRNLPTELGIVADVGAYADELRLRFEMQGRSNGKALAIAARIKQDAAVERSDFATDDSMPLSPQRALADLQEAFPSDTQFISDVGEHMLFCLHYLKATHDNSFTLHLGLGSMGSGICGSIGLALANPNRPVVCICGDGGMEMFGMEALVALKYNLPITFAVFNDGRYNMVHHGFKEVFNRYTDWDTPWVDFAAWGRALGLPGTRIEAPGEITETLLSRLKRSGPSVLDIRIDREQKVSAGGRNESLLKMSQPTGTQ